VLKRSDEQEYALRTLLDNQQDKNSPNYHKWLTPEQFGNAFGPSDADMQTIVGWLQSHGFQVAAPSKGRTVIEFTGSASQVQEAFHTTIHKYLVNGEQHWANSSDPSIPTALTPVVGGVYTLHNFVKRAHYRRLNETFEAKFRPGLPPAFTASNGAHAVVPADLATIYNINPLYNATPTPINGSGISIAVVGRSDIILQDITDFRSVFAINGPTPQVIVNGPDPGDVPGDDFEATLDVSWAGGIAPGAQVYFVNSAITDTTDGVILSEVYIVENNLANVMTASFGGCEARFGAEASFDAGLAEQAAAQGISFFASSGDAGAEDCDDPNSEAVATGPISADLPGTTPFVTAVGGTMFNENGNNAAFWNTNDNQTNLGSAIKYIPEDVWNESCPASSCGANANIAAGGGGASTIFTKPSWQAGVTGIPTDGARDIPDVALTAAGHDPYLICFEASCVPNNGQISFAAVAGTSASTPSFAGIMALIDQKMSTLPAPDNSPRQGLANYVLYPLAAAENSNLSQCKATNPPANTCVFNDVTVGNNEVPGEPGYPNAPYNAGVGYDEASGLGSVNVTNLANAWAGATFRPTTTTLVLSPTTGITHGTTPVNVTINVKPSSGSGVPTGDVSLIAATGPNGTVSDQTGVDGFTLTSGSTPANSTTSLLPGGSYKVHAHYAGDGTFAPSDSSTVTVTVQPEGSTTTFTAQTFALSGNQLSFVPLGSGTGYGNMVYFHATVASDSTNGNPTGTVTFADAAGDPAIPGNPYGLTADPGEGTGVSSAVTTQGLITLPAGPYLVKANYSSDPSFTASSSAPMAFTISQATTSSTVVSSANSVSPGTSVTLTANIATGTATVPSFGVAPTGTVSFKAGTTSIGTAPVTGTAGSGALTNGSFTPSSATASLTTTTLPTGSDTITAVYGGDTNYAGSTSTGITVNVQPDFSLPNSGLGTVTISAPGGSGTVNLSITPGTGFSSAVNFTCTAGLPAEAACNPASIAAGSTTGTMTVTTMGPHTVALRNGQRQNYVAWMAMGGGLAFGCVFLAGGTRKRRWMLLMSLVVLMMLVMLPACGGSGNGGGGSHQDPGTPTGTFTVTVTAAASGGSPSHTTTFSLVVQ